MITSERGVCIKQRTGKYDIVFGLGILSLVAGIGLLVYSMMRGGSEISLVVIFPVISSDGDPFGIIGIFMILAGIIALYISSFTSRVSKTVINESNGSGTRDLKMGKDREDHHNGNSSDTKTRSGVRTGGVVFIGPIPVIFGSDRGIARWMIVAGALIALVMIVFFIMQFSRLY